MWRLVPLGISGWLIAILGIGFSTEYQKRIFVIGMLIFGGSLLAISITVVCPRCGTKIGYELLSQFGRFFTGKKHNYCF